MEICRPLYSEIREGAERITRDTPAGAWPLEESTDVGLVCPVSPEDTRDVLAWMDVENSPRWQPGPPGVTFCNKYAPELLWLLGYYMPVLWWYHPERGKPPVVYAGRDDDGGVHEMSANMLHRWAINYGPEFGLRRVPSRDDLRDALNDDVGSVGVMIAHNRRGHGHIAVCFPDAVEPSLIGDGVLQSQAGRENIELHRARGIRVGGSYDDVFWGIYE